jgi:hypothetical protein
MENNGCVCSELKPLFPLDFLSCPKRHVIGHEVLGIKRAVTF